MPSPNDPPLDLSKALAAVLVTNRSKWLKFVEGFLGSRTDAEDVLQEAVRRVLVRARQLATEDQVRMYLGRAISNTAIELYKFRKRDRLRQLPLEEQTMTTSNSATPQTVLEEQERSAEHGRLVKLLNEGLSKLPLKQYEALRLTVLEQDDTSIRDAGLSSGIPYSTLRHRSVQALKGLRKFMLRATGQGLESHSAKMRQWTRSKRSSL